MANVLLSKDYQGWKAGELVKGMRDKDAATLERLGLGTILKDEEPKTESAKKVEKAGKE